MALDHTLVDWIRGLPRFPPSPDLARVRRGASELGVTSALPPFVHVGGSKGKGSVCALVTAILAEHGFRVALYTSPHLECWRERYRVGAGLEPESEVELVRAGEEVRAWAGRALTAGELGRFEALTLLGLVWMRNTRPDIGVLEVGLGGRLDPTNVVDAGVCVLTNVDLEHSHVLGATIPEIAVEKAGIIQARATVICGPAAGTEDAAVREIVAARCAEVGATLLPEAELPSVVAREQGHELQRLDVRAPWFEATDLELALLGAFQQRNLALALAATRAVLACHDAVLDGDAVRRALRSLRWPLRLQRLEVRGVPVWLDAAHTRGSAVALGEALTAYRNSPFLLLLGASRNKDFVSFVPTLAGIGGEIVLSRAEHLGAAPEELEAVLDAEAGGRMIAKEPHLPEAIELALTRAVASGAQVVVSGSLFLAAEASFYLRHRRPFSGWFF